MIWKIPCVNSNTFTFPSYAQSDSASLTAGPQTKITAWIQNLAVPGFVYQQVPNLQSSSVYLTTPPWKNSLVLDADTTLTYLASLGPSCPSTTVPNQLVACTTSNYKLGTMTGLTSLGAGYNIGATVNALAPGTTSYLISNASAALIGAVSSTYTINPGYVAAAPYTNVAISLSGSGNNQFVVMNASWATPEGVANPQSYGFPQVGINGANIKVMGKPVLNTLPAGTSACLIKPNCPSGMIGTPAINNGKPSYQCVCPIPAPRGGCYPYGIGVQGALGILAATNFLGMCFTLLVPETNGKTLEQLNDEVADDV